MKEQNSFALKQADLKQSLNNLPDKPGIYQFFDKKEKLIYIGKAKSLKKRVVSYFQKDPGNAKVKTMVAQICSLKYVIVDSEHDALLLENNMIKEFQPRYNIRLKDDKTFPWICIKKEDFPRVFYTRNLVRDGSEYFGPYTSTKAIKYLLELICDLFPLRNCSLNLTPENIRAGKFKVCLEYHIGNCLGPCENQQSDQEYQTNITQIRSILKGDLSMAEKYLEKLMHEYAAEFKFELAQSIKEKLEVIRNYKSKSTIVNPEINNVDVFTMINEPERAFVNYMKISNGGLVQIHSVELKKQLDESPDEMLELAIIDIRTRLYSESPEIILENEPNFKLPHVKFTIPQRGDKLTLVELSRRNLRTFIHETKLRAEVIKPKNHSERILNKMKYDLHLEQLPVHIECFDNSNIQGSNPVAACVVFKNAKPANSEYRHFNIKTVTGPNDFASMEEIVFRRYKRLLDENKTLPQLIVIDGGKGQLSAAMNSIDKLNLRSKIAVIGIAKKLEEIFKPGDSLPLYIEKDSETLKIIQQIRDEAHRFGISFHRNQRSKTFLKHELEQVSGIGEKTIEALLLRYGYMDKIRKAPMEELADLIGSPKAKILLEYFKING